MSTFIILLSLTLLLTGCSENVSLKEEDGLKVDGYILDVDKGRILVAEGMTSEQYETVRDKTLDELFNESLTLYYFSYENTSSLKKGVQVTVWIDGGIDESSPAKATAKKVEIIK